ncbi:pyruvate kinase [Holotrichia oblita]|nr:pyruvate kinase [Holotrichia oblita]
MLVEAIKEGVNVVRLNFSHGNQEEHLIKINRVKEIYAQEGLMAAIMLDTRGPEVRTHLFAGGSATIKKNEQVKIYMDEIEGNSNAFSVNYPQLINDVEVNNHIRIDDGLLDLRIDKINHEERYILTTALNTHVVRNRRGVNIPFVKLSLPFVSEKDREDIIFGCEHGVTFVATSFTRTKEDVAEIRQILLDQGKKHIKIIAKIENHEGVSRIEEIIEASDGIMVARGDLGVEVAPEEVPAIQKKIIAACLKAGKPAITATQMLDSMQKNPTPTRAEVSDVANAIYDLSDAIMLSGETASGEYPLEAIRMQATIANHTEPMLNYERLTVTAYEQSKKTLNDAIAMSVTTTARIIDAALIVAMTASGATAKTISMYRPDCPIIAATDNLDVGLGLLLNWAVYPYLIADAGLIMEEAEQLAIQIGRHYKVEPGKPIILAGGSIKGNTDYMKIIKAK